MRVFALTLESTDIKVETEALVYPFTSLVSDFGGALGLFLGFSFLMLWDWIINVATTVRNFKPYNKTRNRQAYEDDYAHKVHTAGLHTSDRLLSEAVREVKVVRSSTEYDK